MKFDKIKTLKVFEFNILCCLMLMVSSKNLLHIDTPECSMHHFFSWPLYGIVLSPSAVLSLPMPSFIFPIRFCLTVYGDNLPPFLSTFLSYLHTVMPFGLYPWPTATRFNFSLLCTILFLPLSLSSQKNPKTFHLKRNINVSG